MISLNEIERRLSNISGNVRVIMDTLSKNKQYTDYDIEAGRVNTSKAQRTADDANTLARENEGCVLEVADVASENDGCIVELSEIASENNDAILELAEYINNLEERFAVLEEKITLLEGGLS